MSLVESAERNPLTNPFTCAEFDDALSLYFDGELDELTSYRLESHVLECDRCCALWDVRFHLEHLPLDVWRMAMTPLTEVESQASCSRDSTHRTEAET